MSKYTLRPDVYISEPYARNGQICTNIGGNGYATALTTTQEMFDALFIEIEETDDGLTEFQKYVSNWNSAPINTYQRPLISNFSDPIYDDVRTHEIVDSEEI